MGDQSNLEQLLSRDGGRLLPRAFLLHVTGATGENNPNQQHELLFQETEAVDLVICRTVGEPLYHNAKDVVFTEGYRIFGTEQIQ